MIGRHPWTRLQKPGNKPSVCDIHRNQTLTEGEAPERDWEDNEEKRLRQLDSLLRTKGISLSEFEEATIKKVKSWQAMHKDESGEAIVTDLIGIEFSPAWEN